MKLWKIRAQIFIHLKVKTAANFYNIEYVYIINNLQKEEPAELLKRVKKTNE